jgi:hypothetical protein
MMHRGRTVLAMDCVLAGAETHRARPLNSVVSRHLKNSDLAISATGGIAREERCVVLCARVEDGVSAEQGYAIRGSLNAAETIGWWFVNPGTFMVYFASEPEGAKHAATCEAALRQLAGENPSWAKIEIGVAEGLIFGAFTASGILESMPVVGSPISTAMKRAIANAS